MNDRFKFRVWDKVFNHYWADKEIKENAAWLLFPDNDNIENIEIEQCTGLKDKNGKLIFEGDVVRINGVQERFEVVYSENLCGFGLKHTDGLITSVTPSVLGGVEVIGNIHKNEELLK